METKLTRITPPIAREWLKRNISNRPFRESVAAGYVAAYQRGEYVLTHQGIAFDVKGNLIDGQHRLTAIASMPEHFSIEMNVSRGLPVEAFEAIDIGLKRTNSDVLRVPNQLAAAARFMASIVETQKYTITPPLLVPYINAIRPTYERLISYTPASSKTWSSSAIRSAAVLRLLDGGDADYILISYHALVHTEFDAMAPIVQALYKQQAKGLIRSGGLDLFARAHKAFDYRKQMMDKIQINDTGAFFAEIREQIQSQILGQKKAATHIAANKENKANSTRGKNLVRA